MHKPNMHDPFSTCPKNILSLCLVYVTTYIDVFRVLHLSTRYLLGAVLLVSPSLPVFVPSSFLWE